MESYKYFHQSVLALFLGYEQIEDELCAESILLFPKPNKIAYQRKHSIPAGYTLPGVHDVAIDSKFTDVGIGAHGTLAGCPYAFHRVKVPFVKRLPGGKFAYHVAKVAQNDGCYTTLHFSNNDHMIPNVRRTKCVRLHNPDGIKTECGDKVLLKQDALFRWTLVRNITKEKSSLESGER
jgi:hypothetical protein